MIPIYYVLEKFDVPGRFVDIVSDTKGFINDTKIVTFRDAGRDVKYVLQLVNQRVFRYPEEVMDNLRIISDHVTEKLGSEGAGQARFDITRIIRTRSGRDFYRDEDGNVWRLLTFIEHARAYETVQGLWHAEECGRTLGRFLDLVSDVDVSKIKETIAGYHVTSNYLRLYDEAPKDGAPKEMLEFVEKHRRDICELEEAERAGILKKRLIHGDPRINNIMIDERTGRGVAMIDLDTSSAGLVQMDVGDAIRSICNPAGEDAQFLRDVTFRSDVYAAFMRGFYEMTDHFLTREDKEYMRKAVKILPFELGLRFFTDHLNGDRYFKVQHRGQNLRRAMGQFKLFELVSV